MRRSPDFYRRLALIALENDAVRVALSLLVLVTLALAGLPVLPTLTLPLLAYAGCRLLASPASLPTPGRWRRRPAGSPDQAHAACLRIKRRIDAHADRLHEAESAAYARRIATRLGESQAAIAADGSHPASPSLLALAETTDRLLVAYLKVVDRGFGTTQAQERLRANLAALDGECERFWVRLNRQSIVDLEALSATIDMYLTELGSSARLGATT